MPVKKKPSITSSLPTGTAIASGIRGGIVRVGQGETFTSKPSDPRGSGPSPPKPTNQNAKTGFGAFGEKLGANELAKRENQIKISLNRTKNVSPDQVSADELIARNPNLQRTAEEIQQAQDAGQLLGETVPPSADLPKFETVAQPSVEGITRVGTKIAIGAGGGAITGGPVGAIVGAVGGVILGVINEVSQDRERVETDALGVYTSAKQVDKNLLKFANNPNIPRAQLVEQYNQNLANLREAERRLSYLEQEKIGKDLKDVQRDLSKVRIYLSQEPNRREEFNLALQFPDPTKQFLDLPDAEDLNNGLG